MTSTNTPGGTATLPKPKSSLTVGRVRLYLILLIIAATVSVFSVVRQADFVSWDDDYNLLNNPHLNQGLSWASVRWMFTDAQYVPRYMPLGWLGYAVNCPKGHMNPSVFLLGNLFLHTTNAVLIFLVLVRVLQLWQARLKSTVRPASILCCAAFGAAFWALHPLRVETVAWASARLYQQSLLFLLLSTLAYLNAHETVNSPRRQRVLFWTSTGLFLASLLTYPLALGFMFVLLLIDWFLLQRFPAGEGRWWNRGARVVWLEKVPYLIAIVLVLALALAARLNSVDWGKAPSVSQFTVTERTMQSFYVWANYLWKTWVPLKLTPMYATLISFNPWSAPFLLSAAAVLGISALLLWRRRSWPGVLGLWICYLLWLVPTLGLTEHPHFACDRYSFVVGILWSVLLSAAALKLLPKFSHPAIPGTACAGLLLTFSLLSYRQCQVWRSDAQLLPHIITRLENHPARAKVEWLYGTTLSRQREWPKAEQAFRNSIRADDHYALAYVHLADVLMDQGKSSEAISTYERALELAPDKADARQGLAIALGTENRLDEAATQFREVLRRDTNNASAWQNLALTVHRLGQTNLSREYLARAQQIRRE
jgi:hypothetical protein